MDQVPETPISVFRSTFGEIVTRLNMAFLEFCKFLWLSLFSKWSSPKAQRNLDYLITKYTRKTKSLVQYAF